MGRGRVFILFVVALVVASDSRGREEVYLISSTIPEGVSYFATQVQTRWHGGQKTLSFEPHSVSFDVPARTLHGFLVDGQENTLAFPDILNIKIAFGNPPKHQKIYRLDWLSKGISWRPRGRVKEIGLMSGEVWEFHGHPPRVEAETRRVRWQKSDGNEESVPFRDLFFIVMEWQPFSPGTSTSGISGDFTVVLPAGNFLGLPLSTEWNPLDQVASGARVRVGIREEADLSTVSLPGSPLVGSALSTEDYILTLETHGEQNSIPLSSIQSLELSRGTNSNVVPGFFLGLGFGLLAAVIVDSSIETEDTYDYRTFGIALGGAILGSVIGATVNSEEWMEIPLPDETIAPGTK
jgi:hypothetical protein